MAERPNILLIMTDQQRFDAVGFMAIPMSIRRTSTG